ncbi:MAG: hypothetical protein ACJAVR_001501 [Paracoccaceae bacterium]
MGDPVSSIPNLGPAAVTSYGKAGIHDAQTLRELGADEAYKRVLLAGTRPHFIGFYALVLGLQGRPWSDLGSAEKRELKKRFTAVKREAKVKSAKVLRKTTEKRAIDGGLSDTDARLRLEAALDLFGVREGE